MISVQFRNPKVAPNDPQEARPTTSPELLTALRAGLSGDREAQDFYMDTRLMHRKEGPQHLAGWLKTEPNFSKRIATEVDQYCKDLAALLRWSGEFKAFAATRCDAFKTPFKPAIVLKPRLEENWIDGLMTRRDGTPLSLSATRDLGDKFRLPALPRTGRGAMQEVMDGFIGATAVPGGILVEFVPECSPQLESVLRPVIAAVFPGRIELGIRARVLQDYFTTISFVPTDRTHLELLRSFDRVGVWELLSMPYVKRMNEVLDVAEKNAAELECIGETRECLVDRFFESGKAAAEALDFLARRQERLAFEREQDRLRQEQAAAAAARVVLPPPPVDYLLRLQREQDLNRMTQLIEAHRTPDATFAVQDGARVLLNALAKGIGSWEEIELGLGIGMAPRDLVDELRRSQKAAEIVKPKVAPVSEEQAARAYAQFMKRLDALTGNETSKDTISVEMFEDGNERPIRRLFGYAMLEHEKVIKDHIGRFSQGHLGDHSKIKTSEHIWEHRIHLGQGYRIYFAFTDKGGIVVLNGGIKKTQDKDIEDAELYYEVWTEQQKPPPSP